MTPPPAADEPVPSPSFLEELRYWVVRFDWAGRDDDVSRFVRWLHEKGGEAPPASHGDRPGRPASA